MEENNEPTEITAKEVDEFVKMFERGDFEVKQRPCRSCGKDHFPNYGFHIDECDQCFFKRFPEKQKRAFFRSFFE